jgi:hypothetical protein
LRVAHLGEALQLGDVPDPYGQVGWTLQGRNRLECRRGVADVVDNWAGVRSVPAVDIWGQPSCGEFQLTGEGMPDRQGVIAAKVSRSARRTVQVGRGFVDEVASMLRVRHWVVLLLSGCKGSVVSG